jgi:predicted metal-dependent hydrolase
MPPLELVSRDVHRILLGAEAIEYVLVRRRGRRGIGLRVDHDGLTVSAPSTLPLARIEAQVRESERWILRKVAEWSARRIPAVEWREGAQLPYLGGSLRLVVAAGARNQVELGEGELRATVRDARAEPLRRAVVAWYKRAALAHLAGRAFALSRIAGLAPPRVILSSALTRWGSCNVRGEVRLSWRLVKARPALVDYVVCHELAHLRHMDHSRAFWSEVERQCPDYRTLRKELLATDHLYRGF